MSGDWIKVELETPDKPEVQYMAGMLNLDPDMVFAKLFRVWVWFDKHTQDGHAHGVTYAFLDRVAHHPGFAEAMALSGWLRQDGHVLVLPNFDRHNGKTAKNRALANTRKQTQRTKSHADVPDASRNERDINVTREEKRRIEEEAKKPSASAEEIFWTEGPKFLSSTGTPEGQARTFLGRCVKTHGIAESMRALEAAMQAKTGDPRSYITAVLEPRNRTNGAQLRVVV